MKTLTLRLNEKTDHYDKDFGPPLPRSMQLWKIWGCSYHEHCFTSDSLVNGEWVTRHEDPIIFWVEHISMCGNSKTCPYFIHYLVGDREAPGRDDETNRRSRA